MGIRRWLKHRRLEKKARGKLREAFRDTSLLAGTSLKPRHLSRSVLIDFEASAGELESIRFGILRHPRPYAFSKQSHEVIEYYRYDLKEPRIRVMKGLNLTRLHGQDACD
ncbi:MAG: hypothetical protein VX272_03250 [Planctomycetota bacterium]|nr:hypothetical protein [Planctomycetota bacterium]